LKIFKTKEPLGPVFWKAKKKKKKKRTARFHEIDNKWLTVLLKVLWSVRRIVGNLQLLHVKICSQIFENHGYVARLVIGSYMNC
jgi:hypothetical protein